MTAKQREILDWLKADLKRRIVVASVQGVECYSASSPVGSGILHGSDVEDLEKSGEIVREGDCFRLP